MAQLTVDIGGRPGIDCGGYCEYCYFRRVRSVRAFGCRHCPPHRVGCDYCTKGVREGYAGFRGLKEVAEEAMAHLQLMTGDLARVTISGGGDPSCYPHLRDLFSLLSSLEAPLHIGYTSGKGFSDPKIADFLIDQGLKECSFTIFASDPVLRKRYMHDRHPKVSLKVLERLCGEIDVYAAAVVLPGVNDGEVLESTCDWLEERGAKGIILMRFANTPEQGLILGNAPLIPGQEVHSIAEFRALVSQLAEGRRMKVTGTPLWDTEIGSPFAILQERELIAKLPRVARRADVITGAIAAPFLAEILRLCGDGARVVPVEKEIACLITPGDLEKIPLGDLAETVIIPGRAFVHESDARRILSADGRERTIVRGPDTLTADGETSMGMTRSQVLELEFEELGNLVRLINMYGV